MSTMTDDTYKVDPQHFNDSIISAVGQAIQDAGLTQDHVADQIGMDRHDFLRHMAGHEQFTVQEFHDIGTATGLSMVELISSANRIAATQAILSSQVKDAEHPVWCDLDECDADINVSTGQLVGYIHARRFFYWMQRVSFNVRLGFWENLTNPADNEAPGAIVQIDLPDEPLTPAEVREVGERLIEAADACTAALGGEF